jgi:hypothetical protein
MVRDTDKLSIEYVNVTGGKQHKLFLAGFSFPGLVTKHPMNAQKTALSLTAP